MMYIYPTQTTFIDLFFPSLFSHPSVSSPFPSNIFSFPPLTILSLLQLFFFTQKTVLLHHPKGKKKEIYYTQKKKKKKKEREMKKLTVEEEACNSSGFMGSYVGIEHCTFDLEFCNLFCWLEVGGKEKKEESLLPAWCDFSLGLLAIDNEGA